MIHADLKIGDGRLLIWKTTESVEELRRQLRRPDNIAEFQNIKIPKRQMEFLAVRAALKTLLNEEFHVSYEPSGKPFLSGSDRKISISHSKEWVAVAVHPFLETGVDIECPSEKIRKICQRFLSETERREFSNGADIKRLQIAWSAKEALYKIIGESAADFAAQMRLYPFDTKEKGTLVMEHTSSKRLYDIHYEQNDEYTLAYALDKK